MAELLDDGTTDWSMGQDAWHSPDRIQPNQYASGVNVSVRGGDVGPRPGALLRHLTFENKTLKTKFGFNRTIESIFLSGKFQACIPYVQGSNEYLVWVVSGLTFRTNINTFHTILLSDEVKTSQYVPRINWSYASSDLVLFDFPAYPVIIDGQTVKRSTEVPIAVLGTYNNNRLFVANAGGEFTAGDPVGSATAPNAPLSFLEVFTPSSPFFDHVLSLPVEENLYPITAMGFIQQLDTNTGIGPLFVATPSKFYYYQINQPRDQWGGQGFEGLMLAVGIPGQRAFKNVNSDLIFFGDDLQIHALSASRNEARKWGNVPISREVHNYVKLSDPELNSLAVVNYFNNRILLSVNPYRIGALDRNEQAVSDYAHGGMVVLELENLASFLSEGTPVWTGLWTGLNPMEIVTLGKRCFVVSKDGCGGFGTNKLYELKEDLTCDVVEEGRRRNIRSIIYTRQYNFQSEFLPKREHTVSVSPAEVGGDFSITIDRKPTHSHEWLRYAEWSHKAPIDTTEMPDDLIVNGLAKHNFPPIVFGDPKVDGCSPVTQDLYSVFFELQYRLIIEGLSWKLAKLKIRAEAISYKEMQDHCEKFPAVKLPKQCDPDWLLPEASVCPA